MTFIFVGLAYLPSASAQDQLRKEDWQQIPSRLDTQDLIRELKEAAAAKKKRQKDEVDRIKNAVGAFKRPQKPVFEDTDQRLVCPPEVGEPGQKVLVDLGEPRVWILDDVNPGFNDLFGDGALVHIGIRPPTIPCDPWHYVVIPRSRVLPLLEELRRRDPHDPHFDSLGISMDLAKEIVSVEADPLFALDRCALQIRFKGRYHPPDPSELEEVLARAFAKLEKPDMSDYDYRSQYKMEDAAFDPLPVRTISADWVDKMSRRVGELSGGRVRLQIRDAAVPEKANLELIGSEDAVPEKERVLRRATFVFFLEDRAMIREFQKYEPVRYPHPSVVLSYFARKLAHGEEPYFHCGDIPEFSLGGIQALAPELALEDAFGAAIVNVGGKLTLDAKWLKSFQEKLSQESAGEMKIVPQGNPTLTQNGKTQIFQLVTTSPVDGRSVNVLRLSDEKDHPLRLDP